MVKRGRESILTKKEKMLSTANRADELKKTLGDVAKTPLTDEALTLLKVMEQGSITEFILKKLEDNIGPKMCERSIPKIMTHLAQELSNFCSRVEELVKIREVMESVAVNKFTQEFYSEKGQYDYGELLSALKLRHKFLEEKDKEKGMDI